MNKKQTSILIGSILLLSGLLVAGVALGSTTAELSVTVTAKTISVTVSDGVDSAIPFGTLQVGTTSSTEHSDQTQTVTNNGTETEDISAYCSDAVGGTEWALAAAAGSDAFVMQFSTTTAHNYSDNTFNVDNITVSTLVPDLASSGTGSLDLKLSMPTISSDTAEKTITVTVVATEAA